MNRTPLHSKTSPTGIFNRKSLRCSASLSAVLSLLPFAAQSAVPMTGTSSYTQNFDTLAITGTTNTWTNNVTIPNWFSDRLVYLANAGTTTNGGLYSFGSTDSTERALGSIGSGSATPLYGVVFTNTSAGPIEINSISYTGEQWRNGGNAAQHKLSFGYSVSATDITDFSGTFTDLTALDFTGPIATTTAAALNGNDSPNRVAKSATTQIIVPAGQFVMLRWSDPNDGGNDHGLAVDDLTVSWQPSSGVDTTPPTASAFSPVDEGTPVLVANIEGISITFSENVQAGAAGTVAIKRASDDVTVRSFPVAEAVTSDNTANYYFNGPSPLVAGTGYYVDISPGAIEDLAGNDYAGVSGKLTTPGNTSWTFSTATPPANPTVVVNKYSTNASPDTVELLVTGSGTPGGTVDMRGMILKDFSNNMIEDGGGKYEFSQDALWSAVPVGTLIVLTENASTTDVTAADFVLKVGLDDPTYFTDLTPAQDFDLATTEMVLIKAAGSGAAGTTGGIHALAGGNPGTQFTNFTGAKTIAGSGGNGVVVNNTSGTISDYVSGFDATGGLSLTSTAFGAPNSGGNRVFISSLRGTISTNGEGVATIVNVTPSSPYNGNIFFDDGQSSQVAKVTLNAQSGSTTLSQVKISVPPNLGTPIAPNVTIAGPGSTGASVSVSGQDITISSTVVTVADALEVTIAGLTTPTPTSVTDNGNYPLVVATRTTSGTLAPIGDSPPVRVVIPISALRDVDSNGAPADGSMIVAVEGVATEENFGTTNTQAFIQDATAGINIFGPAPITPALVRGHRYAVVGSVIQFSGLTEISTTSSDVIDLGVATEPAPEVVTLDVLFASPETYEGKLITVQNLGLVSAPTANPLILEDASETAVSVFFADGSTATAPASYPVNVTGILTQSDGASPLTSGYRLQPRDNADITPGTGGGYATWATANGIPGEAAEDDFDNDGLSNLLEYGLGLTPAVPNGTPGTLVGNVLTFTKGADALTNGDVDWTIETSPTLGAAPSPWTTQTAVEVGNTISYSLPTGQGKVFARLVVTQL